VKAGDIYGITIDALSNSMKCLLMREEDEVEKQRFFGLRK
jgi:hypothetical protein